MSIGDITAAWDRADPTAIHPLRRVSEDAYWQSGEAQADHLATVLEPGCRVVDFGCGDGRVTTWSPAAQTALAHKLRLTRVDSALPWSVWTT